MVVLLLCSLILLTVVIRDLIRFQPNRVMPPKLLKEGDAWSLESDLHKVAERLNTDVSPLGRVLASALEKRNERALVDDSPLLLSDLVEDATEHVVDDLYEDLGPLSTIYTVAPLLGLLGTILGMMSAFREYARTTDRDLSVLSEGIQQALVTTLWGLSISILAYVAARYFERRIRRFEREVLPPRAVALLENLTGLSAEQKSPAVVAASISDEATNGGVASEAPDAESGGTAAEDSGKTENDVESA